ncbi:MAG TPA: P-II family nitrogen regulator, partial [Anaeromyxobacter sp.]
MTKIEAVVRPWNLEEVRAALAHHPWVTGMTVTEVKGYGRQRGHRVIFRGAEYEVDLNPKLKIELVVPDPLVPRILHELERSLRTGKIGDGKLFVTPVEETIRVR